MKDNSKHEISESSCLCASVLKKDAGVVEGDFNAETQRRRGTEFKMTEIGLIPEDWEVKQFSECFTLIRNNTYARESLTDSIGSVANIHYGDVLIKYGAVLNFMRDSVPYLKSGVMPNRDMLKNGDLVFADTAEDEAVGKAVEVQGVQSRMVVAGLHTVACRPREGMFAPRYLGYYINSPAYHNQLLSLITGTKVSSVSRAGFLSTYVVLPPLPEQKAIAEALSDVDELLAAMTTLIEKKRAIKQGAMQELLTGKKRLVGFGNSESSCLCASVLKKDAGVVEDGFNTETQRRRGTEFKMTEIGLIPEDWEVKRLGEIFELSAAGDLQFECSSREKSDLNIYPIYSNSIENAGLYGFTSKPRYSADSITITGRGTLGHAEYRAVDFDAIIRLIIMKPLRVVDGRYVTFQINYCSPFHFEITSIPQLTVPQVANSLIPVPPLAEQRAIAEVLSDMDAEIEALEAKRAKYESIKQSMMQELLTGKTRMKD